MTRLLNDNVFKTKHLSVCSYHPIPLKKTEKEKRHPPTEKNDWKIKKTRVFCCFFLTTKHLLFFIGKQNSIPPSPPDHPPLPIQGALDPDATKRSDTAKA